MKNVSLLLLFLLISFKSLGQGGTDVIFFIDTSNSMSKNEFDMGYITIQNLMNEVLNCNDMNRVAVVQYQFINRQDTQEYHPEIKIEGDGYFSSTPVSFYRWGLGLNDKPYAGLELLYNIFTGVPNEPDRVKPDGMTLTRTPGNNLIIFMLTDAGRNGGFVPHEVYNDDAFTSYTNFKNNLGAKFVIVLGPSTNLSFGYALTGQNAAAAVASRVGEYVGSVESYPSDPDGAGVTGRKLLITGNDAAPLQNDANFLLDDSQLDLVASYLCGCYADVTVVSPTNNVFSGNTDNREASNTITASNIFYSNSTGDYHAGNAVYLKPGFKATEGTDFRAYIEGCNGNSQTLISKSTFNVAEEDNTETSFIKLSPNPANDFVEIQSTEIMNTITVTSMEGMLMYKGKVGKETFNLNVSTYRKGIYILTVETQKGELYTEKLMKN